MIKDQYSWWCRYCLLFPGRYFTSRRLLSTLLMAAAVQIGCFSAVMDRYATASETIPLMDSDLPGWHRDDHIHDGRRSVLVTRDLSLRRGAVDSKTPSSLDPDVSSPAEQREPTQKPASVFSLHGSLMLDALAVFFFLLSMGLLLFVLLTRGRSTQRLLVKQRQMLEDITGNLPAVVYQFFVNADGTYGLNYVNQKAAEILELDVPLASFFTTFTECIHPDDKARFFGSIKNAGKTKAPWHFEGRFIKPSGSLIWFSGDAAPYQAGGHTLFNGVIMDITTRRETEEKLRKSEQLMSQIINFLPDPTFVIDSDSKVIAWNHAIEELTEVNAETILGKGNYEYALPFYGQRRPITIDLVRHWDEDVAKSYTNLERKGNILISETKDHYQMIKEGPFRNVAGPLYDEAGNLIGAIESIHDITNRRKVLNELRAREELLGFFVTYTPVPVAMLDLQMNYLHYSRRWVTDFNLPDEDLTGRCHYDVMRPIPDHWKEEHFRCLQGESIQKEEETFVRADGSVEWVRRILYPWRTHEDKIGGIIILVELTTEKKRAEQTAKKAQDEIHKRQLFLESLLYHAPDAIITLDDRHQVIDWNPGAKTIFGYTRNEAIGKELKALIAGDDARHEVEKNIQNTLGGQRIKAFETVRYDKNGRAINVIAAGSPIALDENLIGVVVVYTDITALKQAQDEIHKRQLFLEAVLYQAPDAIIVMDADHRVTDWNPGAEKIFGYKRPETLGKVLNEIVADNNSQSEVMNNIRTVNSGQRLETFDAVRYRKDGTPIHVLVAGSPIVLDDEMVGAVAMYTDITALKKAEADVKRNERMLRRIMDMVPSMIFVKNAQGRFLMANQAVADSYGMPVDALVGRLQREVHPDPEQVARYMADDRQTIQSGHPLLRYEEPFTDHTGAMHWLEVSKLPCDLSDFGEPALVVLATDITERRQVEAMLRISQFSFDKAAIGIYWLTSDATFFNVNEHAARMLGYSKTELAELSVFDIDPDMDPQTWKTIWQDLNLSKQDSFERVHRRKDGSTIPVEIFSNHLDYNGEDFSIAFVQDITERHEANARIQESEKRYRMIFENTGTGTVLSEADMTLTMVNREFAQMVGYARREIEGKMKWTEFIAPDDVERLKDYHFARRKDPFNTPNQYECKIVDRAGRLKPMLLRARLIPGTQTSIGAFLDISDRKQTEEALVVANRMLRLVLDTIPVYVFWKDTNCRYLGCNRPFAENAGFSDPEALIGRDDYELVWYKHAPAYRRDDRAVMKTGQARLNFEEKQTTATGKTVWVQTSKVPMRDGQDNIIGLLGTFQDITESKLAREELQRLRNYLSNIIDSMPSVLIGVDNQMRITQWNKQAEKQTGLPFEKAHKQPLANAYPRLADELGQIKAAIKGRKVNRNLKIPRQHQGETQFEDITIFPLEANGVEGAVIRLDDVTEQVRMEEMMIQSEKMLSVGGLAAGMAHEINNPLAGILQNTAVLENRLFGDLPANHKAAEKAGIDLAALRQYLEIRSLPIMLDNIRASGNRAAAIVKNMLSFARKSDRVVSSHNLGALLDQTLELAQTDYDMKKHYDFKQIQIVREYDETTPPVPCESSKIQQVFLNILKNGAEAMAENAGENASPTFVLRVKDDDPWVRVEIEDNGPGMDETTRRRIFEPFFTTKPVGKGTGLGLSVSYFIITENHGGKMDAHVVEDSGTQFIIQLPKSGIS